MFEASALYLDRTDGADAPPVAAPVSAYSPAPRWLEVLVDCPSLQEVLTYQVPPDLAVQPGDIVSVPLQKHQVGGLALRWAAALPPGLDSAQVRPLKAVVATGFLPSDYVHLLDRTARYYDTPLMGVLRAALPPGLLGRSQRRVRVQRAAIPEGAALPSGAAQQVLSFLLSRREDSCAWVTLKRAVKQAERGLAYLVDQGWAESYLEPPRYVRPQGQPVVSLVAEPPDREALTPRRRELLRLLRIWGGEMEQREFLQRSRTTPGTLKALAAAGYVVIEMREVLRLASGVAQAGEGPKTLNAAQAQALATLQAQAGFRCLLLHGVTGSGKTEVYLQAIAPCLARGDSALVLVPEIGLTPQLTDRFQARFGDRVRVYHSGLSAGERYDTWRQMLTGEPQVVIGTRSAVFAPLPRLGLIVLDEEHDASFKEAQRMPSYQARTVAQWRAQLADCPLLLGSATPALETWQAAHQEPGWHYLNLPQRVGDRPLPPVEVVDMRRELHQGNRSLFSQTLHQALAALPARGEQAILFVPRRGHSTFVSCRSCGAVLECPHCDVALTYHYTHSQLLRCHYCNHRQPQPHHCPHCGSPYLKHFGSGTQRVTQELSQHLPALRWLRFDSDTTQTKGAHRQLLDRFGRGEAEVLVGTQMLTKGLDLPRVTLVAILAADGLLHRADYRASERAYQTLTQVAGRAGRGDQPGRVILQTYSPDHPVVQAVSQRDYARFAQETLAQRQQSGYPPFCRLILLRFSGLEALSVEMAAQDVAIACRPLLPPGTQVLGPAPASILRIARRYHWQVLLKLPLEAPIPSLGSLRSLCPAAVRFSLDIDPLSVE